MERYTKLLMSKIILITRPNHDLITTYLFEWSQFVIDEAIRKNFKVLDLSGKRANKKDFASYVLKNDPILLFFNGHGNEDVIAGYDNKLLVSINENTNLLKRKIIYARSCDAANNLGELCIKNGTIAFVGYKKKYSIAYTHSGSSHPLKDQIAKLFIEPSNLIPISLLKGNSVKDAYRKSQEAMSRNFSFMLSTRATQAERDAAPYLWINKKYQVVLGDSEAKIN